MGSTGDPQEGGRGGEGKGEGEGDISQGGEEGSSRHRLPARGLGEEDMADSMSGGGEAGRGGVAPGPVLTKSRCGEHGQAAEEEAEALQLSIIRPDSGPLGQPQIAEVEGTETDHGVVDWRQGGCPSQALGSAAWDGQQQNWAVTWPPALERL